MERIMNEIFLIFGILLIIILSTIGIIVGIVIVIYDNICDRRRRMKQSLKYWSIYGVTKKNIKLGKRKKYIKAR